ncbi:MAG: FCD domain-containing protein [Brevundimonas sp.]
MAGLGRDGCRLQASVGGSASSRRAVEPAAAALAAERRTTEDLAAMREAIHRLKATDLKEHEFALADLYSIVQSAPRQKMR